MHLPVLDQTRIHLFSIKERYLVLDVNSCVFFEIDEIANRLLALIGTAGTVDDLVQQLAPLYGDGLVLQRLGEILSLIRSGDLFSEDQAGTAERGNAPPLSTLCLNVAHKCNLRCEYCFAEGNYGRDKLMTPEIAEDAVDFLIRSSKQADLSVSFFGGEPLLNFPVIKHTVAYARSQEPVHGKRFRFHITTNGTILNEKILRFLESNQFSMIISLDGPRDVHDSMRKYPKGQGSYDVVRRNLAKVAATWPRRPLTVRSTFTPRSMEVDELAMHLFEIGCKDISVEPCATEKEGLQFAETDLKTVKEHYDLLAERYLAELTAGKQLSFFHLRQAMEQARRKKKRLNQCGAANGYLAVGAEGKLYPCHKFVGNERYVVGHVSSGIRDPGIPQMFHSAHVRNKDKCMSCWARYACGGGCHSHAITFNDDILEPYGIECELIKHRVELGAYLHATLSDRPGSVHG
jgi:uncharacterized protein